MDQRHMSKADKIVICLCITIALIAIGLGLLNLHEIEQLRAEFTSVERK